MKRVAAWLLLGLLAMPVMAGPRLVVFDVGEGQSLLVQQGNRGLLIDTGHPGMARHLLDRLDVLGVVHLDYLILTHLHPDHAGGYFRLRETWPETPVLYSGHPLPADVQPDLTRWMNDALQHDPYRRVLTAGDVLGWQEITLQALWPDKFVSANLNHHSLVLLLRHGDVEVLVMGDADAAAEAQLLTGNRLPEKIEVLVVGHHGAADATSDAFLARVKPALAIVSVNRDNIRGYPATEVLQRLEKNGARVLRTDRQGEIRVDLCARTGQQGCRVAVQSMPP